MAARPQSSPLFELYVMVGLNCKYCGCCSAPEPFLLISWARTPKAHFWRKWAVCVRVGGVSIFWFPVPRCRCRRLWLPRSHQPHAPHVQVGAVQPAYGMAFCQVGGLIKPWLGSLSYSRGVLVT